jgi:hypothetical protein
LKRAAIEWAQDNGIPLTRGQMTDSWMAKSLENWFSKLPGSQKFYRDTAAAQQSAIDRIINAHTMEGDAGQALQTAGAGRQWISDAQTVDAAQAMPGQFTLAPRQPTDALNTAARYFGKAADAETPATAMVGGREMPVNDAIAAAMQSISPGKGPLLPEGTSIPMVGPKGDYNNYQAIRSQLTKAASDQSVGTANQTAFQDLRGIFDQTAERSLAAQGADPQMLAKIRAAYTIDKTLLPAGTVLPDGTMSYSLPRITNIINAAVKDGTLPPSIAPDLVNVADFGRSIKSVTSSNTAEHGVSGAIATGGLLGHAAGGGEAASSIIKALLGLIAVPWGMSALMQGTRMGIPGLRNIPTETLGRLGMGLYGQAPDVARTVAGAMPSATTGQ